ncbi:MAG TPA: hypothetical protein VHU61_15825 [Solirubrobacteraceae bacterium]|jgi:hypothetical protein|nr:hypothetical protein [Solirubrobacteraceae bacterium]
MTTDTNTPDRLVQLGEALDRAVRADLATRHDSDAQRVRRPRRLPRTRRMLVAAVATVVLVPAAAVAATQLLSTGQVAASLPQGTLALMGTHPTCTTVTANVEYHCVLAKAPGEEGAPAAGQWNGTVEDTVDASKHVNGGCRSLNADGTEWQCYIGQAAVQQKIIGASFLGQQVQGPGVG